LVFDTIIAVGYNAGLELKDLKMCEDEDIRTKYITTVNDVDNRIPLNQNLQPDIQKIDSIIRKITEKKAPYNELMRLEDACERLKATIAMQIRRGG